MKSFDSEKFMLRLTDLLTEGSVKNEQDRVPLFTLNFIVSHVYDSLCKVLLRYIRETENIVKKSERIL